MGMVPGTGCAGAGARVRVRGCGAGAERAGAERAGGRARRPFDWRNVGQMTRRSP